MARTEHAITGDHQSPPLHRQLQVEGLRSRIRTIEKTYHALGGPEQSRPHVQQAGEPSSLPVLASGHHPAPGHPGFRTFWGFGAKEIDALLGPSGLDAAGVHEFKPAAGPSQHHWVSNWAAVHGLVLALAGRRLRLNQAVPSNDALPAPSRAMLWCVPVSMAGEYGGLYGGGLPAFGLDPAAVLLAAPSRQQDLLWAMEEGIKVGRLGLVAGLADTVGLTPARRLALAAEKYQTPCLLMTSSRSPATAATLTRWRVAASASAMHERVPGAPGRVRIAVWLERCRSRGFLSSDLAWTLEWSDETYCFRVVAAVADRADAPGEACAVDQPPRRPVRSSRDR